VRTAPFPLISNQSQDKSSTDTDEHGEGATPTLMTFHEAVPAASVLKLIEKMNMAIATKQ
jgi:hypothetical protein